LEFRHLKIAFYSLLTAVALALIAVISVLVWVFTNPRGAWDFAGKHFLPADLSVTWEKIDFHAARKGWKHWDAVWTIDKLSVEKKSPAIHAPIARVETQFSLDLFTRGPWFHFSEFLVNASEPITYKPGFEPSEASTQSPFQKLHDDLGYLDMAGRYSKADHMLVKIADLQILGEQEPLKMTIEIQKPSPDKTIEYSLKVNKQDVQSSLDGWVDANEFQSGKPFLQTNFALKTPAVDVHVAFMGLFDGRVARFEGEVNAAAKAGDKRVKAQPRFKLSVAENEAILEANSPVTDLPGPIASLDDLKMNVRLPMDNDRAWSERPAVFNFSTKLALFFIDQDMRPLLEKSCHCKIPEKLYTEIEGRFYPEFLLNEPSGRRPIADTNLKIEGLDNKLFTASLAAHVKVDKQSKNWIVNPRFDSQIEIRSFQGLRQFLDAKNVIVPSPIDVLDGTIKVSARGDIDRSEKSIKTPVEIKIELKSPTQKVSIGTTVTLELANDFKSLDVYIQALIRELKIELPPLDPVLGIPALTRDPRLVMKPEAPAKKDHKAFKTKVYFNVKTESAGAIQLLSKLADPLVPVTLDMNNSAKGESSGFVRFEPFAITYLRRRINVERLQVTLSEEDKGDFPVGGRFRIDQTSYKIFVDVGGTTSSPIVQLNSEPFLPRNDIISVLLYNRTSDQLVSADSETVGSFEAALADRAIGLFGLWAFASTPIRSFSYNAVTHVYTATVDLGGGITASVGTNWERAASLEVRKRVSRRWVLTASWSPTESNEQVGKLVLQWEKRF
jgi:hypothetical protein